MHLFHLYHQAILTGNGKNKSMWPITLVLTRQKVELIEGNQFFLSIGYKYSSNLMYRQQFTWCLGVIQAPCFVLIQYFYLKVCKYSAELLRDQNDFSFLRQAILFQRPSMLLFNKRTSTENFFSVKLLSTHRAIFLKSLLLDCHTKLLIWTST